MASYSASAPSKSPLSRSSAARRHARPPVLAVSGNQQVVFLERAIDVVALAQHLGAPQTRIGTRGIEADRHVPVRERRIEIALVTMHGPAARVAGRMVGLQPDRRAVVGQGLVEAVQAPVADRAHVVGVNHLRVVRERPVELDDRLGALALLLQGKTLLEVAGRREVLVIAVADPQETAHQQGQSDLKPSALVRPLRLGVGFRCGFSGVRRGF